MNGRLLYYLGCSLAVLHYLSVVTSIVAQQNVFTPDGILQGKMEELNRFVQAAEANSKSCSALKGCSSSCSRSSCYQYGIVGDPNYQCVKVFNNTELCGQQSCALKNFDFSRSFVRRVDVSSDTDYTLCIQSGLDEEFKQSSSMNDSTRLFSSVFFGAKDGSTRIYPAADEYCDTAQSTSSYDPRLRPWYKKSLYVPKVVFILIDSGPSMTADSQIVNSNDKYLDKAITMALTFLDTLTDDTDYVNIYCFDGDGALKSPNITSTKYSNPKHYKPINDFLASIRSNSTNVVKSSTTGDVSRAINSSIIQLNSALFPLTYVKVVIVLTTAGLFGSLSDLGIPANSGVNLFVYSFNSESEEAECNATVGAFSKKIPSARLDNPLYALESYYSFIAKVHINFYGAGSIDYSPKHADFSGIDINTLTLSKAAFDKNGELLGVVGTNVFELKFGELFAAFNITFQDIVDAAQPSLNSTTFDVSKANTSVCFNPYSLTENCPNGTAPVRGLNLCGADTNKDISVGCCRNCTARGSTNLPKILGGVAGGVGGLVMVAFIGLYAWCNKKPSFRSTSLGIPSFPGSDLDVSEAVNQGDNTSLRKL